MSLQTCVFTRNPLYAHIFSWKIENISKFTDPVTSPTFSPIPFSAKRFHFELRFQNFDQNSERECLLELYLHIEGQKPEIDAPLLPKPNVVFGFCQSLQKEIPSFGSAPKSQFGQPLPPTSQFDQPSPNEISIFGSVSKTQFGQPLQNKISTAFENAPASQFGQPSQNENPVFGRASTSQLGKPSQNESPLFGNASTSPLGQPKILFKDSECTLPPKAQAFNCSCKMTLSNTDGTILTSAKTWFKNMNNSGALVRRVLFTALKKNLQGPGFLDLLEDKLIMKASFSISGFGAQSDVVFSSTTLPASHFEFLKDMKTMFESGYAHDVTFSVGGKNIPAHKAIIGSRSPVLAKMFQQDAKNSKIIPVKDSNFDIFKVFLLFLYTGDITDKNWETTIALYSLAVKYQVLSLRNECGIMLVEGISMGSFYRILMLAKQHGDLELKKAVKNFCRSNFDRVVETEDWSKIVGSNPELASYIMKSIDSPIPPEAKKICVTVE